MTAPNWELFESNIRADIASYYENQNSAFTLDSGNDWIVNSLVLSAQRHYSQIIKTSLSAMIEDSAGFQRAMCTHCQSDVGLQQHLIAVIENDLGFQQWLLNYVNAAFKSLKFNAGFPP